MEQPRLLRLLFILTKRRTPRKPRAVKVDVGRQSTANNSGALNNLIIEGVDGIGLDNTINSLISPSSTACMLPKIGAELQCIPKADAPFISIASHEQSAGQYTIRRPKHICRAVPLVKKLPNSLF
eukprot:scaffold136704_cov17-Prasinocladus_malaysianus.AAC.1